MNIILTAIFNICKIWLTHGFAKPNPLHKSGTVYIYESWKILLAPDSKNMSSNDNTPFSPRHRIPWNAWKELSVPARHASEWVTDSPLHISFHQCTCPHSFPCYLSEFELNSKSLRSVFTWARRLPGMMSSCRSYCWSSPK